MPVKIVLVDDHAILRTGLISLLTQEPGFKVVAEASNGYEALNAVEKFKPNVLVLDLAIPGINGLEVTYQVTQRFPETRVVILSMYAKEAYVVEAFRNGALAYVLKGSDAKELVQAIHHARKGKRYLGAPLNESDLEKYLEHAKDHELDRFDTLTNRERQIFQMAANGLSSTEIGKTLVISNRTVEVHRAKILHKLGLNNQAELIRYAMRRGGVTIDEENLDPLVKE